MRNYFLLYDEAATVNYKHLLKLYGIAEYNKTSRRYDTIKYNTLEELTERIKAKYGKDSISKSALSDFLNDKGTKQKHGYKYFTVDKDRKEILLSADFRNTATDRKERFVILTQQEFDFLSNQKESLLIQYFLYIKYHCGASATRRTDFTANQFLAACGLCCTSGGNKEKISRYNDILKKAGLVSIQTARDSNGHNRNTYGIISLQ